MKFSVDKEEKYTLIKLDEEKLDSTIAPDLKSEFVTLNAEGTNHLILDLSAVKYCDSSGLSALLVGNRIYSEAEGSFVITQPTEFVKKLITISQLESVLSIMPTVDEAVDLVFMNELEKGFKEEGGAEGDA